MPLRRQWAELSLEKKLSIVVIPLAVALIGVLPRRARFDFWSAVPAPLRSSFETPASFREKKCMIDNETTYKRLIRLDGERSPELTASITQPK